MLRYSNTSDRSAHAEHSCCISNCDAFRILEEDASESASGYQRQSMDVVDPHRHVSEARGEHTQKTAFGCMSMDNIRFAVSKVIDERSQRHKIFERSNGPLHYNRVERNPFALTKRLQVIVGRGNSGYFKALLLHKPQLTCQKSQRLANGCDMNKPERTHKISFRKSLLMRAVFISVGESMDAMDERIQDGCVFLKARQWTKGAVKCRNVCTKRRTNARHEKAMRYTARESDARGRVRSDLPSNRKRCD